MEEINSEYSKTSDPFEYNETKPKSAMDTFTRFIKSFFGKIKSFFDRVGYINTAMVFAIPIFWLITLAVIKPYIIMDYPEINKKDNKYNVCFPEGCYDNIKTEEDINNAMKYGGARLNGGKYILWTSILTILTYILYIVIRTSARF